MRLKVLSPSLSDNVQQKFRENVFFRHELKILILQKFIFILVFFARIKKGRCKAGCNTQVLCHNTLLFYFFSLALFLPKNVLRTVLGTVVCNTLEILKKKKKVPKNEKICVTTIQMCYRKIIRNTLN